LNLCTIELVLLFFIIVTANMTLLAFHRAYDIRQSLLDKAFLRCQVNAAKFFGQELIECFETRRLEVHFMHHFCHEEQLEVLITQFCRLCALCVDSLSVMLPFSIGQMAIVP